MNQYRSILIVMIVLSSLALPFSALAQQHEGGPPEPVGGRVTAITDTTITVLTSDGEKLVVNLGEETTVFIALTQTEGSVTDLENDATVQVMGRSNDDGSVDAGMIVVTPAADVVRGQVTAVTSNTITVEDRRPGGGQTGGPSGEPGGGPPEGDPMQLTVVATTIGVDDATQIMLDGQDSSISDVSAGQTVSAYGETQDDGSLIATVIVVSDEPQGFGLGPEPGGQGPGGPGEHPGPGGPPGGGGQRPGGIDQ